MAWHSLRPDCRWDATRPPRETRRRRVGRGACHAADAQGCRHPHRPPPSLVRPTGPHPRRAWPQRQVGDPTRCPEPARGADAGEGSATDIPVAANTSAVGRLRFRSRLSGHVRRADDYARALPIHDRHGYLESVGARPLAPTILHPPALVRHFTRISNLRALRCLHSVPVHRRG